MNRLFGLGLGKCCDCSCCGGGPGSCTPWTEDWSGSLDQIESNWEIGGVMNFAPSLATPGDPLGSVRRLDWGGIHSISVEIGVLDLDEESNQAFTIGLNDFTETYGIAVVSTGDGSTVFWVGGDSEPPSLLPIVGASAIITAQWTEDRTLVRFSSGAWEAFVPFATPIDTIFLQGAGTAFIGDITTACEPLVAFDFMILEDGDPMLTEQGLAMQGEF